MATYNYSIEDDFSGNIDISQLDYEIDINSGIEPNLEGITASGDVVAIEFDQNLSAGEKTVLDGLVSNHTPDPSGNLIINIPITENRIESTTYVTIATINFPGTNKMDDITNFKIIGFMEEDGTSYDIKLLNIDKNQIICSANLSNEDEVNNDLGIITNLPKIESTLELQCKINGNTVAHIKNFNIHYNQ